MADFDWIKLVYGEDKDQALTAEQLEKAIRQNPVLRIVNLKEGGYISKQKYQALEQRFDEYKAGQPSALEGYQEIQERMQADFSKREQGYLAEIEGYKQQVQDGLQALADQSYDYAVRDATRDLKFSSVSAEKAFKADLKQQGLSVVDGKLLGVDKFIEQFRAADPAAFAPDPDPEPEQADRPIFAKSCMDGKPARKRHMSLRDAMIYKNQNPNADLDNIDIG